MIVTNRVLWDIHVGIKTTSKQTNRAIMTILQCLRFLHCEGKDTLKCSFLQYWLVFVISPSSKSVVTNCLEHSKGKGLCVSY